MKIVAFDLDGTVADTIPMCIKAFCESVSPYTDHTLTEKELGEPVCQQRGRTHLMEIF